MHIQRTYTYYIVRAFWIEVDNKGIQVFVLLVTSEFLSYRLQDGESFHDGCKKKFSGNRGEVGCPTPGLRAIRNQIRAIVLVIPLLFCNSDSMMPWFYNKI